MPETMAFPLTAANAAKLVSTVIETRSIFRPSPARRQLRKYIYCQSPQSTTSDQSIDGFMCLFQRLENPTQNESVI